jgi:hypothetical protein
MKQTARINQSIDHPIHPVDSEIKIKFIKTVNQIKHLRIQPFYYSNIENYSHLHLGAQKYHHFHPQTNAINYP